MKRLNTFIFIFFMILKGITNPASCHTAEHTLISDTLDAIHYGIHLDVIDVPANFIEGYTDILITSKYNDISQLHLELLQLGIDSILIDNATALSYSHTGSLIEIELMEPVNIGDTVKVTVFYQGIPFHEGWGGFHFAGNYAFNLGVGFESDPHNLGKAWFPCIDDFHDRASYDCYIRVSEENTAVCGGELISVIDHGDNTKTYHWYMENTIPTYLASVAIGNYECVSDTFYGMNGALPIDYYVRSSETGYIAGSFIHMHEILETYESRFGPYSWPRVGYVSTAIGAMEHATNIAYPYGCINGGLNYEWLYAHELSHMWFGDKVTCASAEDMWINEGWAVFCESLFREGVYGIESYKDNIAALHRDVLQYCHTPPPTGDGQYFALYGIPTEFTYGNTVYDKGSLVVHTLRGYLGDEIFFDVVKAFLQEFAFDYMSSFDLRDFITLYTGINMYDFFDAWVFHPGFPHFSIDSFNVIPDGENYNTTVYIRQKTKGGTIFANNNKVKVTFMDNNWNQYSDLLTFSGETGVQQFTVPFEPLLVMPDLEDKICDATTDQEMVVKNTGEVTFTCTFFMLNVAEIIDSAYVRVTHNWAPPDSLKTPVNGLRLSDYRYWSIDGIFPENFIASGIFQYNRNNYLDNTLIASSDDSLVILYRSSPAEDWQSVDFTQIGPWSIGNLVVDHIQPGEYTLAVWDHTVGANDKNKSDVNTLEVFPNPSASNFTLHIRMFGEGKLLIYDSSGKVIETFGIPAGGQSICWQPESAAGGIYYLKLLNAHQDVCIAKKVIYLD